VATNTIHIDPWQNIFARVMIIPLKRIMINTLKNQTRERVLNADQSPNLEASGLDIIFFAEIDVKQFTINEN